MNKYQQIIAESKSVGESLKKVKGCMDAHPDIDCIVKQIYTDISYSLQSLQRQIDWISQDFYKHSNEGHLPPIEGAEKMQNAMTKLGIDGDYEVRKPVIYASNGRSMTATISLNAKKV